MKFFVRWILQKFYNVKVEGLENLKEAGDRVLIVANHLSFLDAVLLAAFLPEKPIFAVNTFIAKVWWIKPFLSLVRAFPVDPTNPLATKALIAEMKKGGQCVIFPEGRITVTGALMKIYEGPGMIADKAGAKIVPVRFDGAQYTPFSRLRGKVRMRLFPDITIRILKPRVFDVPADICGRARRRVMGKKLYDLMTGMMFQSSDCKKTLFQGLLDARAIHGGGHKIAVDITRKPMGYNQIICRSFILGSHLAKSTESGEYVGMLLPNMTGTITAFFALQAFGRIPAMLNYSTGAKNAVDACRTAKLKTVLTSRRFIEVGKLQSVADGIEKAGIRLLYLEDVVKRISPLAKVKGFLVSMWPQAYYNRISTRNPEDAAVLLFTSGSEGTPKGVVLSHLNIQSNYFQLSACIDFGPKDKVFNVLPIFHSFGLTAGTLLPLFSGIQVFFYPSPLHYRVIPELVYDTNTTILFGTDTFLSGYAKFAHPYDFYSLRYVFAGAEKLKEETSRLYAEKYGIRIFEGYGTTETSPVLAMNTPIQHKSGTVGRLMPGIEYRLDNVPGVKEGGRLFVRGPNVMKGYLLFGDPGVLVPLQDGWYDTGDIVSFDDDGHITIKGRAKRFAKIAGEMVSLTAAETIASEACPGHHHAVVSIPDQKKGEALVLVTDCAQMQVADMLRQARDTGVSELMVPRKIKQVDSLPVLGTGKTDYVALQKLVNESSIPVIPTKVGISRK